MAITQPEDAWHSCLCCCQPLLLEPTAARCCFIHLATLAIHQQPNCWLLLLLVPFWFPVFDVCSIRLKNAEPENEWHLNLRQLPASVNCLLLVPPPL
jgi:hypothetical protein